MSINQKKFLRKTKLNKIIVLIFQISLVISFLSIWEYLAYKEIISTFIYSSPSLIIKTIYNLFLSGNLFNHIFATLLETIIAFTLGIFLGFIIALTLFEFRILAKIVDPFLTMLNSLPKVALGPLIIIIAGANIKSIIVMALLINLIISIITIYNGFINTDPLKIKLLKSFKATKLQILRKVIIPESFQTIIASLKLNISMSLIGVIMGEFLVSKQGIGYLIIYGTQVFNLSLVMSGIFILIIMSFILYNLIIILENKLLKNKHT